MNESDGNFCLDSLVPEGVEYFRLPLFDHFNKRPYHRRAIRQEWNSRQLHEDMASHVIHSDIRIDAGRPEKEREHIRRLLFRLDQDVFCYLQMDELIVYAPTAELADQMAKDFATKYAKPPSPQDPCFYLINAIHDEFRAESVKIT